MNMNSDFLFIGGGPGGYEVAAELAALGKSVTLVEKGALGGTCLNRGCIPTKALAASAALALEVGRAADMGIDLGAVTFDYGRAHARACTVLDTLREDVAASLAKVNVVHGEAVFVDNSHVAVGNDIYTASRIVIATGSRPAALRCPGSERAITSDDFLALDTLPAGPVVIIGGGVIGLEFASILNAFGCEVTVVEYCREVLPGMDAEIAKRLRLSLSRRGINFMCSTAVEEITDDGVVRCSGKKGPCQVEAKTVIAAVGRRPVVPGGLENTDIKLTDRGFIAVDSTSYATGAPGVYAVGDVNGLCMLAHAASAQARKAVGLSADTALIPSVVFTEPQCAAVGQQQGSVTKIPYSASGMALASGYDEGLVKLVCDDAGIIVGCHVLGAHAADLVAEATVAIACGLTAEHLATITHAHPTLSELLQSAARFAH